MEQGDRTRLNELKKAFPDFGVGDPFILTTYWSRTGRKGSSGVG